MFGAFSTVMWTALELSKDSVKFSSSSFEEGSHFAGNSKSEKIFR